MGRLYNMTHGKDLPNQNELSSEMQKLVAFFRNKHGDLEKDPTQ